VSHTHDLTFADSRVVKRYTSWERGEHVRDVSDPAMETAILMEHLSWRGIDCAHLRTLHTVDDRRLPAARRLWAMFWLRLLLLPGGRSAGRNPAGAADHQARRVLMLIGQ
jgi:hypothetical protein